MYRSLLLVLVLFSLVGCAGRTLEPLAVPAPPSAAEIRAQQLAELYRQPARWRGTPYRLGGDSREGIDCSAFVMQTYADIFGVQLPRTTRQQARLGNVIERHQLDTGDLVFFRTSRKVRHVGIYVEDGLFLHASTSEGVRLSELGNPYWRRHYWHSRRVLD